MASIYIHIPYCKKRCIYCNFYFKTSTEDKLNVLTSIQKEIKLKKNYLNNNTVNSIYFGGGTPSILNNHEIFILLKKIREQHNISNNAEITLECNPEDLSVQKLEYLKEIGINRLSIGIQSFNNPLLKFMNRSHDANQAVKSITYAKKIGINNISIDLMYGMPNQSMKIFKNDLNNILELNIPHFSAYILTVEKNTLLKNMIKKKQTSILSDEKIIFQFNMLTDFAKENNFLHYEISNFGKKNFLSKHNISYWKNKSYLGLGPAAHSYNGVSRSWNISSNKEYIKHIEANKKHHTIEHLNIKERYNEYIFTNLRTMWGVNKNELKTIFGENIYMKFKSEALKWMISEHLLKEKNLFILSNKGKLFADKISADLFL